MLKGSLLFLAFLPLSEVFGSELAHRPLHVDYKVYESRALNNEGDQKLLRISALRSARKYSEAVLPEATPWASHEIMQERFENIRDKRFLTLSSEPDFPRRISWLYPKDGCFARASLFNRNAVRLFIPIPKKVLALG